MRQHAADASACRPTVEADAAAVTALRSGKYKDISPNGRVVPRSLNRVLRLAVPRCAGDDVDAGDDRG